MAIETLIVCVRVYMNWRWDIYSLMDRRSTGRFTVMHHFIIRWRWQTHWTITHKHAHAHTFINTFARWEDRKQWRKVSKHMNEWYNHTACYKPASNANTLDVQNSRHTTCSYTLTSACPDDNVPDIIQIPWTLLAQVSAKKRCPKN